MDEIYSKYKKPIIVIMFLVAIFLIYKIYFNENVTFSRSEEVEGSNTIEILSTQEGSTKEFLSRTSSDVNTALTEDSIIVHISGAVKSPRIIILKEGDRVNDAIIQAGGSLEDANFDYINLAQKLEDGDKIVIPTNADVDNSTTQGLSTTINTQTSTASQKSAKVNINKASQEELETLTGIGEQTAKKIILYRQSQGSFKSIEDIKNVNGIGDSKFENIKDSICV